MHYVKCFICACRISKLIIIAMFDSFPKLLIWSMIIRNIIAFRIFVFASKFWLYFCWNVLIIDSEIEHFSFTINMIQFIYGFLQSCIDRYMQFSFISWPKRLLFLQWLLSSFKLMYFFFKRIKFKWTPMACKARQWFYR